MATPFKTIINKFLGKITDDMYIELTLEDTLRDAKSILLDAIPYFEFPRFELYAFDEEQETYDIDLTDEEVNILALLMKTAWLDRQINSIENTRMKYSGADFKMTSQANHLSKLLQLKSENVRESTHAQRLYKRRCIVTDKGQYESNWNTFGSGVYYGPDAAVPTVNGSASGGSSYNPCDDDDDDIYTSQWEPII